MKVTLIVLGLVTVSAVGVQQNGAAQSVSPTQVDAYQPSNVVRPAEINPRIKNNDPFSEITVEEQPPLSSSDSSLPETTSWVRSTLTSVFNAFKPKKRSSAPIRVANNHAYPYAILPENASTEDRGKNDHQTVDNPEEILFKGEESKRTNTPEDKSEKNDNIDSVLPKAHDDSAHEEMEQTDVSVKSLEIAQTPPRFYKWYTTMRDYVVGSGKKDEIVDVETEPSLSGEESGFKKESDNNGHLKNPNSHPQTADVQPIRPEGGSDKIPEEKPEENAPQIVQNPEEIRFKDEENKRTQLSEKSD
ncbi:hypothetical protein NEOLI_001107, partial [Neolecta irregularis DAH-3]